MNKKEMDISRAVAWPPIDEEVSTAVLAQLLVSTSIYDGSGVFAEFEEAFARLHGLRWALTVCSGTAALHSAYFGLGLGPGDEVLCPDYTFFATAAPLFQLGAQPVLFDCALDGTTDLRIVESQMTERTRALVISHMWGRPEDVEAIRGFCDNHRLFMIEDCSHAHGAAFNGVPVGSKADAAVWSLQASKTVPAGEGGVLGTRSQEVFERALLLGHFNKRCFAGIPPSSPYHIWAETGLGLKYRAHPLGIAMANVFLRRLPAWLIARRKNAGRLAAALSGLPITNLRCEDPPRASVDSYYSFVMVVGDGSKLTPNQVVADLAQSGFIYADVPRATRPLHKFPLFQSPVSPVVTYDRSCVRGTYPNASRLGRQTFKIPVPHVADVFADAYCASFKVALKKIKYLSHG